jgi:N,N'-diacetylchitobiose transport system substrate-binding protein
VLEDLFSALAQGGDPAELAAKADEQMDTQING